MKKPIVLIASLCLVALGVLGYTLLYAGSTGSNKSSDEECAAACEKAHAGAYNNAASAECPYAAKKAGDGCCAAAGKAEANHDNGACRTHVQLGSGMTKDECSKFHESAKAKADAENAKIDIK